MGLLSIFKRKDDSPGEAAAAPDAVAAARTRARRRLIGATVLLGIGVIGFPLLFETQPRPIPVDIPIEIPRKDGLPPLALPPLRPASAMAQAEGLPARPASAAAAMLVERADEQGREVATAMAKASAVPTKAAASSSNATAAPRLPAPPASAAATTPTSTAAATAALPKATAAAPSAPTAANANADAARAQALLEGRAAASEPAGVRIVVQVGAYTDADKLREARQKVEKLGLKTYTQVIEVDGAKRTRVRVGPFDNRDEAEKTAGKIRDAGLPVALFTL